MLGLMLIAGAVSIYLASKQSYTEVEQVANLTENARFAEQVLGDSCATRDLWAKCRPAGWNWTRTWMQSQGLHRSRPETLQPEPTGVCRDGGQCRQRPGLY